jgi:hypothetical protein
LTFLNRRAVERDVVAVKPHPGPQGVTLGGGAWRTSSGGFVPTVAFSFTGVICAVATASVAWCRSHPPHFLRVLDEERKVCALLAAQEPLTLARRSQ